MGLGISKKSMKSAFDSGDVKKLREFEEEFANQKVFGLTGKPVKRSRGFR